MRITSLLELHALKEKEFEKIKLRLFAENISDIMNILPDSDCDCGQSKPESDNRNGGQS